MGRGWYTSENGLVKFVNRNDANGYYKALGLSPDASREEIQKAYRRLLKELHPDLAGDEELFRFLVDMAKVLLDGKTKSLYDSVESGHIFVGDIEREELIRNGFRFDDALVSNVDRRPHWACLTSRGFPPDEAVDAWIDLCWEVSPAVGYRGKIRVGVIEGGSHWPCNPNLPWGILSAGQWTFVVFQRGVEPNRLYALCAMIDWQNHLLNQIHHGHPPAQDRKRTTWL